MQFYSPSKTFIQTNKNHIQFLFVLLLLHFQLICIAQSELTSRIYAIPVIPFVIMDEIQPPVISSGGDSIVLSNAHVLNLSTLKVEDYSFYGPESIYKYSNFFVGIKKVYQSANLRFMAHQFIGCRHSQLEKGSNVSFSQNSTTLTTANVGFIRSEADKNWAWYNIEANFVLGITNDGTLIMTEPSNVSLEKNSVRNVVKGEVQKMKGLWLYHPVTKKRQALREEFIKDASGPTPLAMPSSDGKIIFALLMNEFPVRKAAFFDIVNGAKTIIDFPYGQVPRQIGRKLLLTSDIKKKHNLFRMSDGKNLLENSGLADSSVVYLSENDEVCLYNKKLGSVAIFEVAGDELKVKEHITLDQKGLISGEMPYLLLVSKNHIALFPEKVPQNLNPGPHGYAWADNASVKEAFPVLFDRKTGAATNMIMPYFHMAPSQAEVEETRRRNCKEYTAAAPWKPGSIVCPAKSIYESNMIFAGVDCERLAYKFNNLTGTLSFWLYQHELDRYKLCANPGTYAICPECNGMPHYTQETTVKDDRWEQVNFNVYVRDLNKTRTEYVEHHCKVCNGAGYVAK
jgi:hypothetical protein